MDLQGDVVTYHHLDLVWFGVYHNQGVPPGAADGDYERVGDTFALILDELLDDVDLHGHLLLEAHEGCGLWAVLYGGLIRELRSRDRVTFGLEMLVYASETAS